MTPSRRKLERIFTLARRSAPPRCEPVSPDAVSFFARRVAATWARQRQPGADPNRLWERVGAWSIATATALVLLVIALRPAPPQPNPFDPSGPDEPAERSLF